MPNPKKPTALAIVEGNPGHRPLNKEEPKPTLVCPPAPHGLSDRARKHWRKVVKQLYRAKLMTEMDVDALAMYCELYARWAEAMEHLNKEGPIITPIKKQTTDEDGNTVTEYSPPRRSPWLITVEAVFPQMKNMLNAFGMTPEARSRVTTVPDGEGGGDGWDSA